MNIDSPTANIPTHVTVDIMSMLVKLREDLAISLQVYQGETCYVIEDPLSSRFYRVGLAEYTLLSLLDGQTTIAEAMGKTAAIMGPGALTEQDTAALCKWLIDAGLASTQQSSGAGRLLEVADRSSQQKRAARLNPIFQKVPLFNPDPWATRLIPYTSWMFSGPAVVIWFLTVTYGFSCFWSRWESFHAQSSTILARSNWIWLLVSWLLLKLIHESAHALACKRYGGTVREAGILFILFAPLPYVDVTSAWRFDSKQKRIITSAAGMYAELFIAGCAAIVWSRTDAGLLHQHAQNVMITASVVTVLFNANALMRFDGYYMLADWLELPNLATHGVQWLRHLGRRYVLGMAVQHPTWPEGKTAWIIAYGFAALAFRIFITVSLILAAEALLFGAGIVLALAAVLFWIVIPGWRLLRCVFCAAGPQPPCRRRIAAVTGFAALILWLGWSFLPWYSRVSAPAIVDYYPLTEIRSPVGGFVSKVLVATGDDVSEGELLVSLRNEELKLEAERLRIEIAQSAQRARKFRQNHEIAAFQVEVKSRAALAARLQQFDIDLANLQIRAPIAGRVTLSELQDRMGTYVPAGDHIMSIGSSENKRIQALVPQQFLEPFRSHTGQPLSLHIWGFGTRHLEAKLELVHPRASSDLIHPALSSMAGGPLSVRVKSPELGESANDDDAWQLTEPHFPAVIQCQLALSQLLKPGQTGFVQFRCYRGTFGHVFSDNVAQWLRDRQDHARRMW